MIPSSGHNENSELRKEARKVDVWTIGPLVLQKQMLMIAAAVAVGYVAMRWRLRSTNAEEKPADRFFEVLLLWLAVWKLSVWVFHPQTGLDSPWSLLYFSGGTEGAWLASFAAAAYVWLRDQKSPSFPINIDSWLVSILVGYTSYRIFELFFSEVNTATTGLIAAAGAAAAGILLRKRPPLELRRMPTFVLAFVVVHVLISTVAVNTWEKAGWGGGQAMDQAGQQTGIGLGQVAPDFELLTLQGQPVKLSDFRGKKVVLNFWATWCPPCRVEMPHMQRFYSEYKDNNVVILSVDATHTEASKIPVQAFVDYWGLTFPVVLDTTGDIGKTYQVTAYPATYVIDEQGKIRKKHPGAMDQAMLEKAVKSF
ncbi:hypothetical protein CF651_18665 [Paenibacillus rigui]|uniref:Thioredoxin domain-containing protein n=1 Tax=Paenibacillus rigui TaxID=554312 RepID=A0A229UNN5_9BACL|nr:hypothetical protein CF651_18665 [Paenibacillus rigui]